MNAFQALLIGDEVHAFWNNRPIHPLKTQFYCWDIQLARVDKKIYLLLKCLEGSDCAYQLSDESWKKIDLHVDGWSTNDTCDFLYAHKSNNIFQFHDDALFKLYSLDKAYQVQQVSGNPDNLHISALSSLAPETTHFHYNGSILSPFAFERSRPTYSPSWILSRLMSFSEEGETLTRLGVFEGQTIAIYETNDFNNQWEIWHCNRHSILHKGIGTINHIAFSPLGVYIFLDANKFVLIRLKGDKKISLDWRKFKEPKSMTFKMGNNGKIIVKTDEALGFLEEPELFFSTPPIKYSQTSDFLIWTE